MMYGFRSPLRYQSKLKRADLLSLKSKRIKQDLISIYGVKSNLMNIHLEDFFKRATRREVTFSSDYRYYQSLTGIAELRNKLIPKYKWQHSHRCAIAIAELRNKKL